MNVAQSRKKVWYFWLLRENRVFKTTLPAILHFVDYHRFRFYATIGGFSSKENCVSAAVNHRYHIRKCMRRAGSVSNGFQLSLACSLFIYFRKDLEYKILRRFFMLDVRF